jgi:hypothetical protein
VIRCGQRRAIPARVPPVDPDPPFHLPPKVRSMSSEQPSAPKIGEEDELPPPVGTLFFTMIYIVVLAGMWLSIYFEFIGR